MSKDINDSEYYLLNGIEASELGLGVDDPASPLVLYRSRASIAKFWTKRMVVQLAVCLFLFLLSLAVVCLRGPGKELPESVFYALGPPMGVLLGLMFRKRKEENSIAPLLEITADKLVVNSSITVPWAEIRSIEAKFGCLWIHLNSLKNVTMTCKAMDRVEVVLTKQIVIPGSWLPLTPDEVMSQIEMRRQLTEKLIKPA